VYHGRTFIVAFGLPLLFGTNIRADVEITNWFLGSTVFDSEGSDTQASVLVQNPFNETIVAQVGDSFVSTNYDVSWLLDYVTFDMVSSHHAEQVVGRVVAGGNVTLTPMADSVLSLSAQYQYAWHPSVFANASLSFSVVELGVAEIFHDGLTGGNTPLGDPFGTLILPDATVGLLAGREYKILFSALIDYANEGSPGQPGISTANISFSITPVPEPSTLMLFGLIAPAILRARRTRRN
jgi:hypothetical protein